MAKECYQLPQDEFVTLGEVLQIVRARREISGSEGGEGGSKAELRNALHKGEIATEADLVRGPWVDGYEPLIRGDRGATLGPPVRGEVPPDLWKFAEAVLFRRGAVAYQTESEACVYRSVRLRRADVESLWPPASAPTPDEQRSEPVSQGSPAPREASERKVVEAVRAAYAAAKAERKKPPNTNELADAVQQQLREEGYRATKNFIRRVGDYDEFKPLRWKPGQRSEQRARQG
jgi:hypothetical protein